MTDRHELLQWVIRDLRRHQPLVDLLESPDAIDEGWPGKPQQYPVVVRVQPAGGSSTWRGGGMTERTSRFQFFVVAQKDWLERTDAETYYLEEIMSQIADRLDIASGYPTAEPGGAASGSTEEVSQGRRGLREDWRIVVRPTR